MSPASRGVTEIRIDGAVVRKESVSSPVLEIEKARRISELGKVHGFVAPMPIRYEPQDRVVTFERVQLGDCVGDLLRDVVRTKGGGTPDAFLESGRVLGAIHRHLRMDDVVGVHHGAIPRQLESLVDSETRRLLEREARDTPVIGHGDYGPVNLFVGERTLSPLTVLDSFPNFYSSFSAAVHESRYCDLALFDSCLLGRGSVGDFRYASSTVMNGVRSSFLDGYQSACDVEVDTNLLRQMSGAVLSSYFVRRRGWNRQVARFVTSAVVARQKFRTSEVKLA